MPARCEQQSRYRSGALAFSGDEVFTGHKREQCSHADRRQEWPTTSSSEPEASVAPPRRSADRAGPRGDPGHPQRHRPGHRRGPRDRGDAADAAALSQAASGATSIVNAVNPRQYTQWARDWPPVAAALLSRRRGHRGGPGDGVEPLRLRSGGRPDDRGDARSGRTARRARSGPGCGTDALAAHRAGRLRATELRASDYFGPGAGAGTSYLNQYVVGARPPGPRHGPAACSAGPTSPHSWTYLTDIGAFAAVLATDDRSWGQRLARADRGAADPA